MSLYRKYRPMDFSALKGQEHVSEILKAALSKDRVAHAYLFTGPRGTGKTSTARILSRALNCLKRTPEGPCNSCEICQTALEGALTDIVEIDAASHGLVDDARALVEQAKFMPSQASKKVYIIDEVHMLSKSAFNALLKIIEEPPEHVHFIMATTEAHKVLETIKSRCQRFDFHLASEELIAEQLKIVCEAEKVKPTDEALAELSVHARGSFRDGLSLLEQVIGADPFDAQAVQQALGLSEDESVQQFVETVLSGKQTEALQLISELHQQGVELYQFCQAILSVLRSRLVSAQPSDQARLISVVEVFFEALSQLRDPVLPELPLEMAVLKATVATPAPTESAASVVSEPPAEKKNEEPTPEKLAKTLEKEPVAAEKEEKEHMKAAFEEKTPAAKANIPFEKTKLLENIQTASLKTLIKYADLHLNGDKVTVAVRSEFELKKLQEKPLQSELQGALEPFIDANFEMRFMLKEASVEKKASPSGISLDDLESVF